MNLINSSNFTISAILISSGILIGSAGSAQELTGQIKKDFQIVSGWLTACDNIAGAKYDKGVEIVGKMIMEQLTPKMKADSGFDQHIRDLISNNPEEAKSTEYIDDPMTQKIMCDIYLKGIRRGMITQQLIDEILNLEK